MKDMNEISSEIIKASMKKDHKQVIRLAWPHRKDPNMREIIEISIDLVRLENQPDQKMRRLA
jgi:D-alanine-D-alanine ligase-like ATP-grasp enzyme